MNRQIRLLEEIEINLDSIKSLRKLLSNVYNICNTEEEIDIVCNSINTNLVMLYEDCERMKEMMYGNLPDDLYHKYNLYVPQKWAEDQNALYQL